jgi:hypothetical protein
LPVTAKAPKGIAMGHNDHIDWDLLEFIRDLVEEGEIEEGTSAFGVAQQVIHSGYESLSAKQRAVYDLNVAPALKRRAEELKAIHAANSAD